MIIINNFVISIIIVFITTHFSSNVIVSAIELFFQVHYFFIRNTVITIINNDHMFTNHCRSRYFKTGRAKTEGMV